MKHTFEANGASYGFAGLPVKVVARHWKALAAIIMALAGLVRFVADIMAKAVQEGSSTAVDKAKLIALLAGDEFQDALAQALGKLSGDQVDAISDLMWESFRRANKSVSERDDFDELLTVDLMGPAFKAFLGALGLEWGKEKESGEAKPG